MQFLRVLPNPWAAIDKDGHPCGVCPRDPGSDGGGPGQFVGARLDREHTEILQNFGKSAKFGDHAKYEIRSAMQRTKYAYLGISSTDDALAAQLGAKEAIELPITSYYKERLREGALIPFDSATAKLAGIPFTPPAQYLAFRAQQAAEAAADGASGAPAGAPLEGQELPADGVSRASGLDALAATPRKRSSSTTSEA